MGGVSLAEWWGGGCEGGMGEVDVRTRSAMGCWAMLARYHVVSQDGSIDVNISTGQTMGTFELEIKMMMLNEDKSGVYLCCWKSRNMSVRNTLWRFRSLVDDECNLSRSSGTNEEIVFSGG